MWANASTTCPACWRAASTRLRCSSRRRPWTSRPPRTGTTWSAGTPTELIVSGVTARATRAAGATDRQPLRVLEVGAGVGGTSADLVAALAPYDVHYTFTDVSHFFLAQARQMFADHDFVDYRTFDINRPPAEQGFSPCSFDVVVCANVLHNAVNIDDTPRHAESPAGAGGLAGLHRRHRGQPSVDDLDGIQGGPARLYRRARGDELGISQPCAMACRTRALAVRRGAQLSAARSPVGAARPARVLV